MTTTKEAIAAAARAEAQEVVIQSSLAAGYADSTWLNSRFKHELTNRITDALTAHLNGAAAEPITHTSWRCPKCNWFKVQSVPCEQCKAWMVNVTGIGAAGDAAGEVLVSREAVLEICNMDSILDWVGGSTGNAKGTAKRIAQAVSALPPHVATIACPHCNAVECVCSDFDVDPDMGAK